MIFDSRNLRDHGVGRRVHLNGVLAQNVSHQIDVMDHAVMENAAGDFQVLQGGEGGVTACQLDLVNLTQFPGADLPFNIVKAGIKAPVESAKQRLSNLVG